jgi:pimeloyl-[acyl-carrier protein] methyl ester esterase
MSDFVARNGSVIKYSDHGEGIPVLFLHGWMMSRKVWSFQEPLSGQFRVITMDLRGHGDSLETEFSYELCIGDISDLLTHLKIVRAVIVGWSMGAQIALRFHGSFSRETAGMVLVGGTPCFCQQGDNDSGLPKSEVRSMAQRLRTDYKLTSGDFFKAMFADGEIPKSDLVRIAGRTLGRLPDYPLALSALNALKDADLRGLLPEISVPVLLIHGTGDRICLPEASKYMASNIPGARLELLENRGHAPFLTDPERFNSLLASFVHSL